MPYTKNHKTRTRQRILQSAYRLFSAKGFKATSIDDVMQECGLTRGGFYAHFQSKAQLYQQAMGSVAQGMDEQKVGYGDDPLYWLDAMLVSCVSSIGATEQSDAHWTFLVTDLSSNQPEVRASYANAFKIMSRRLQREMDHTPDSDKSALAAMAMIVGALTVAMTVDDLSLRISLVKACREHANSLIEGGHNDHRLSFFWTQEVPNNTGRAPAVPAMH